MRAGGVRGISVVVPCHNCGEFLVEAIESLVAQPRTGVWEIVLVDDASDDAATLHAIDVCRGHKGVRVVRLPERAGVQQARTAGLRAARCDYVLPLDCDDRLATDPKLLTEGGYAQQAVQILAEDPEVAFVHTFSRMVGDFDGLTISAYPADEQLIVRKHHAPLPIVYRRRDGLAAGGYDPAIRKWQDWAFAVDLLATRYRRCATNRIHCLPRPFHEYRIHQRWGRLSAGEVSELETTLLVVERNLDYFQAVLDDPRPARKIAELVCAAKPDRLTELLHMAAFDLDQALTVARQRKFTLSSPFESLGIP
ncbi:glycosyltransferase family 2 protein [Nocardia sp. NPDC051570]|uniref:glycosyltransferase family 2 protein n=1 Tax=Nocardia sp. NPDC051570 TaxID=3364324 RepID=UPI003789D5E2